MVTAGRFGALRSSQATDYLAFAIAVSLPWSTSAAAIFITLWLLVFLPTLLYSVLLTSDFTGARNALTKPAGWLPFILVGWAAIGMFWAELSWAESFGGLRPFLKILCIPAFFAYFQRSDFGIVVIKGYIASCVCLLILASIVGLWPQLQWWYTPDVGVPVNDYIAQSAEFAVSAFWLLYIAIEAEKNRSRGLFLVTSSIALAFIAFMLLLIGSRTELVVIVALVFALSGRVFGWKGLLWGLMAIAVGILVMWKMSDNLDRIAKIKSSIESYRTSGEITSVGYRLEFWKKSVGFIAAAPLIGHGTGSIEPLFKRSALGKTGLSAVVTSNPHNQILAVGIQLGLVGIIILCVMWVAHLWFFRGAGTIAWFGFVIVVQNILGSLFNSHLFDFTEGWTYVFFVGLLGGLRLREIGATPAAPHEAKIF